MTALAVRRQLARNLKNATIRTALLIALVTVAGHAVLVARAKPVEALRCE
jgi:hypothetical protein